MSRMFFYNANVRTMDPARPRPASILVENGRILAVGGNRAALAAARGAPCIDLEGKTLLPGFIDGHSHLVANSYRRQQMRQKSYASSLTQVPGVGPATAKALLASLKSVGAVRQASAEELAETPGVGPVLAAQISAYFHPQEPNA